MSFAFGYFISENLHISITGDTGSTYSGIGSDYGVFHIPTILDYNATIERIAHQAPVCTTVDETARAYINDLGQLYVWGNNLYGELGLGDTTPVTIPTYVDTFTTNAEKVFIAPKNIYVIKKDGTLWGAGFGERFARAAASTADEYTFIQIGTDTTWDTMVCHPEENLILNDAGDAFTFGYDTMTALDSTIISISSAGSNASGSVFFLVDTSNNLYAYSKIASYSGLIPGEDGVIHATPFEIGVGVDWKSVYSSPYADAAFAVTTDGDLYYWGTAPNTSFFGLGSPNALTAYSIIQHPTSYAFTSLCVEAESVFGQTGFNALYGWGYNSGGHLGFGEISVDDHMYDIYPVHNESAPYYTVPNALKAASDSLDSTSGSVDITLQSVELYGTADSLLNIANISLPKIRANGEVLSNYGVNLTLPKLSVSGTMLAGRLLYDNSRMSLSLSADGLATLTLVLSGSVTLPKLHVSALGTAGRIISGLCSLPELKLDGSAFSTLSGGVVITLPELGLLGSAVGDAVIETVVYAMNTTNEAFSTHTGNAFIASAKLGNSYLVGRPDGLFVVDGVDDDGSAVLSELVLPMTTLGLETVKHIRALYIDVKTDSQVTVTVTFDTGESYSRILGASATASTLKTLKFIGKRDVRGRAFSISLSSSGAFELNRIKAFVVDGNRAHD